MQLEYHKDYNKNVKGQWCETPYFDVAVGKMVMDNLSDVSNRILIYLNFYLHSKNKAIQRCGYEVYLYCKKMSIIPFFPAQKKYTAAYEDMKDQIYFMQTETPTYNSNKKAGDFASEVSLNVFFLLCTYGNKLKKIKIKVR